LFEGTEGGWEIGKERGKKKTKKEKRRVCVKKNKLYCVYQLENIKGEKHFGPTIGRRSILRLLDNRISRLGNLENARAHIKFSSRKVPLDNIHYLDERGRKENSRLTTYLWYTI